MKVKPLKIKIKEPTPSAADRLYAKHQAIRKSKGLPDPSEYKKKLDAMKSEEIEQLDEISPETKSSYKSKAQAQVKELKPWTKKGEYKDLAKNIIAKRQKGIAKVSEETELDEAISGNMRTRSQGPLRSGVMSNVGDTNENIPHTPKTEKEKKIKAALDSFGEKMKKQYNIKEQHIDGRFHPVKPHMVKNTATASPRKTSDSANVKLKEVAEPTGDLKKACWKGYTAVGMKMKNGRKVPNCVPIKESDDVKVDQISTDDQKFPKKMSRKAKIVKDIAKGKSDQFQSNPVLDSDVNPQTNKQ